MLKSVKKSLSNANLFNTLGHFWGLKFKQFLSGKALAQKIFGIKLA
jgi:hypothetical protein